MNVHREEVLQRLRTRLVQSEFYIATKVTYRGKKTWDFRMHEKTFARARETYVRMKNSCSRGGVSVLCRPNIEFPALMKKIFHLHSTQEFITSK